MLTIKLYLFRLSQFQTWWHLSCAVDVGSMDMLLLSVKCHRQRFTSALGWHSITKNKQNYLKVVTEPWIVNVIHVILICKMNMFMCVTVGCCPFVLVIKQGNYLCHLRNVIFPAFLFPCKCVSVLSDRNTHVWHILFVTWKKSDAILCVTCCLE